MTKEDKIQIALGLKKQCVQCEQVLLKMRFRYARRYWEHTCTACQLKCQLKDASEIMQKYREGIGII